MRGPLQARIKLRVSVVQSDPRSPTVVSARRFLSVRHSVGLYPSHE
jgi:hypothetical protein